ncbi:MAG: M20/M25/M40 family metallo-hydrolase, partial [Thermomicrobiales bacterium]|nr:M20/M25/M40 family metallo-hydrolase [Thermomicrobiales bacterium]
MVGTDVHTNAEPTRAVMAWIDETADELIAFLAAYVQQRSVNPGRSFEGDPSGTKACQEWLREQLAGFGAFDDIDMWDGAPDEPNLAAVVRGGGGAGSSLMFNGHTDTIGVGPEQKAQWLDGDPWSARILDGKLYGRGSTDMKAGIAAFIWAARAVRAVGLRPAADLTLTMTIGEETGEPELGPFSLLDRGYQADLI